MGMSDVDFSFGVVLDEFFNVHEAELIRDFFLGCHRVPQLPI